ncbi:hypothetical protein [Thiohalophilus sp.]|uniref:chorismate transformation enzyme, FkbO/Hyg5 family n=1 Tax=Thiohalophilus sp. TaxID=3028392 RepID=UPI002ACECC69|nr:hypothetical protein [Thiohalophilus sp.]
MRRFSRNYVTWATPPLHIWNYLSDIVGFEQGVERYPLFCTGRHVALATEPDYKTRLPAASTPGTTGPGFIIYKELLIEIEGWSTFDSAR